MCSLREWWAELMIMVRDWSSLPDMVKRWGAKGGVITRKWGHNKEEGSSRFI